KGQPASPKRSCLTFRALWARALYWEIGNEILDRQARQGWGAKVIERLAQDLRKAFPDMSGLSRSNLMAMRSFAEAWP
ncbi:DUF1016 N-terminal domain-containing protein, partial [Herbaspirillum sp. WGmk3]|uniref:DUF1016 N-terminal domain-containing protein n=1 Tax=Herbaspirillum sp. WGmk3 TaxID=2919925 RepID=UPI002091C947